MSRLRWRVSGPHFSEGIWYVYDNGSPYGLQDPWKKHFPSRAKARAYATRKNKVRTKPARPLEGRDDA